MAFEKTLLAVPAQSLLQNGSQYGQVEVASTVGFKLKQKVKLKTSVLSKDFEVKAVLNETQLLLGPVSASLTDFADLTQFTVAAGSILYADAQDRQAIPPDKFWRAVFEESPTVAIRTFAVDHLGRPFTASNPVPVQLTDGSINIESLNANLQVQLDHRDNFPNPGDVADSVRIGDGQYQLNVNPDGSINTVTTIATGPATPMITRNIFNEVSTVGPGSEVELATFTVPPGKTGKLEKVSASGENIAKYTVKLNGSPIDVKRTYWTGGFNVQFDFTSSSGYDLAPGDIVSIDVRHDSQEPGDFDARLQILEIG